MFNDLGGIEKKVAIEAFVLGYMHNMAEGAPLSQYDMERLGEYLKTNEIEDALIDLSNMGLIKVTYCK